ncbi:Lsr2 family DNA-binding protein [Streptomyces gardneri]|uniref:Lsr2 family DNA-binding protein n=1 Tax=Streptomyces gardneri TaxID=66892 RepID=UPI001E4A5F7E|nr:histone-like nucleoid-structuring protein Lsr2 [Streptomyces gardneri]
MRPFTSTTPAPPTTIDTAPQPPTSTTADTNDIRAWARANGYDVPDRARLPVAILDAWKSRKPIAAATANGNTEVRPG